MKKIIAAFIALCLFLSAGLLAWSGRPILGPEQAALEFTIANGSGVRSAMRQLSTAGAPASPLAMEALARLSGQGSRLKAGTYLLKPGVTPAQLIEQMVRGEVLNIPVVIIEGWTFRQMREKIAATPGLKGDTQGLSDADLLAKVAPGYRHPEGLFFPDTYLVPKGSSELQVYRQAHARLLRQLQQAWDRRASGLPYSDPYQALIMASIVEKETGQEADRPLVAAVFINRLRKGMLLQTDPSVIYGMGGAFDGNIRKRDLLADTPYNTYTRAGLPPTPISLPGAAALAAALNPASSDALYFVARGDGSSHFSNNLNEHNQAVGKYQK